jgi:arylsulfatase A-like enzyme
MQNDVVRTGGVLRVPGFLAAALLILHAVASLGVAQPAPTLEGSRPHIVHIVADDLGWKDVGFNGLEDFETPNLDKVAAEGAVLSQFYTQPMCTPTRAVIMTGRYPHRYGLQTLVIPSVADYGLDTSEVLLPQILKEAGYRTAIIGKWHLGHADEKYWPGQRGFDYQYGAMIGEIDYFTHQEGDVLDWFRDHKPVREEGYSTTLFGKDAARLIESHDPSTPLYLYLAFNAPHTPYQAPQEYIDRFPGIEDPTRRTYAGMVSCLDDEIGRVLGALERAGMREDTLIIFHSDNGGTRNAMLAGVMADMSDVTLPCDNGPYRDGKGSLYEGGTRVCALVNWPGRIGPGSNDGMMHVADLYPTLAWLAGAAPSAERPLDGVNAWGMLADGAPSARDEIVYSVEPFRGAIRQGDWKLVWFATLPSRVELYNLSSDPFETTNLAEANQDRVRAMQARLNELASEAARPLFFVEQFGVVMENMQGEAILPIDEAYNQLDLP